MVFKNDKPSLLLLFVEQYVNAADIQARRIERARKGLRTFVFNLERNPRNHVSRGTWLEKLCCDVHFYFICLGQVDRLLARLCRELKNRDLQRVHSQFKKELKPEFRNGLEHLEDRVFGLKKSGRKKENIGYIQDFINFTGGGVSFNRKLYPVEL